MKTVFVLFDSLNRLALSPWGGSIKTPNFKATRKKPGDSGGNNDSKDSCLGGRCCRPSYACRFCCYMCKGRDRLYNEIRKQFWGDLFVMGVRSTILLAVVVVRLRHTDT